MSTLYKETFSVASGTDWTVAQGADNDWAVFNQRLSSTKTIENNRGKIAGLSTSLTVGYNYLSNSNNFTDGEIRFTFDGITANHDGWGFGLVARASGSNNCYSFGWWQENSAGPVPNTPTGLYIKLGIGGSGTAIASNTTIGTIDATHVWGIKAKLFGNELAMAIWDITADQCETDYDDPVYGLKVTDNTYISGYIGVAFMGKNGPYYYDNFVVTEKSLPFIVSKSHLNGGQASSFTVPAPSGVVNGDMLILTSVSWHIGTAIAPDDTWTALGENLWWKIANNEPTQYVVTYSTVVNRPKIEVMRVINTTDNPIDATSFISGTGLSSTALSVTPNDSDSLLILIFELESEVNHLSITDNFSSKVYNSDAGATTTAGGLGIFTRMPSSSPTGDVVGVLDSSCDYANFQIAIKPFIPTTLITISFDLEWKVIGRVALTPQFAFGVNQKIVVSSQFEWDVASGVQIIVEPELKWDVLKLVQKTFNAEWNMDAVASRITVSPKLIWNTREQILFETQFKWVVLRQLIKTIELQAQVRSFIELQYELDWGVRNNVTATPDLKWAVNKLVPYLVAGRPFAFSWRIAQTFSKTHELDWAIPAQVPVGFTFKWQTVGRIVDGFGFAWQVRAFSTWTDLSNENTEFTGTTEPSTEFAELTKPTDHWNVL